LRIDGEIDISTAVETQTRILRQVICHPDAFPGDSLEIDCSGLEFIDSSGLGMLLRIRKSVGRTLVLVNVPDRCRSAFELTALDTVFELR
jgi:anti-anti-sigma factor